VIGHAVFNGVCAFSIFVVTGVGTRKLISLRGLCLGEIFT
jgi:hypothetical protein